MKIRQNTLRDAVKATQGHRLEIMRIALVVTVLTAIPAFSAAYLLAFNPYALSAIMVLSWIVLVCLCFVAGEYQAITQRESRFERADNKPATEGGGSQSRSRSPRGNDGQRTEHREQREGELRSGVRRIRSEREGAAELPNA